MGFSLTKTSLASNKPPQPVPLPPNTVFPITKTLSDGRQIWISVPQPDKLTLIIPINQDVIGDQAAGESVAEDYLAHLGAYLLNEPCNAHVLNQKIYQSGWKEVTLSMGARHSPVRFERLRGTKKVGPRLRIECNPRKLGPAGFKKLADVLGGEDAPFSLQGLVSNAKISRLDIAIDIVGVRVSEVVAWHKKQGKRSMYVGADGVLETVLVHRQLPAAKPKYDTAGMAKKLKPRSKPAGQVLLIIYDKVREKLALLRPAPFGDAPVTRTEIEISRLGKSAPLSLLPDMQDRFADLRVGYFRSQVDGQKSHFARYLGVRRTSSPANTAELLGLSDGLATQFAIAEGAPVADLVAPHESWKFWSQGLEIVGLAQFIASVEG